MTKSAMSIKRHELLTEISELVTNDAVDFGLPEDVAQQLGDNIANSISENFGGQNFTFPQDYVFKLAQRDLMIYDEFKGNNWAELSKRYGITERGLRKLINRVHKRVMKQKQPALFDFSEA